MFEDLLPSKAEFRKLATRNARFVQNMSVSSLPRVASVLYDNTGRVGVDITFDYNHRYQVTILGKVDAQVTMICQRCLKPMPVVVESDVNIIVTLNEEQAKELDRQFDPLIADTEWIDLNDLVQEEVLLSLPFVSYHKTQECGGKQFYKTNNESVSEGLDGNDSNPFQILSSLKTSNKE